MNVIKEVKQALRISESNTAFDDEVQNLIDAARLDLQQAGISKSVIYQSETDPLIKRAVITYAKANFGYDNPEADRFDRAYIMLKQHLSLYGDFQDET